MTASPPEPLLELCDVHAGYPGVTALRGVSLSIARGETVALIGANGAGKTTLLRAVAGLASVSAGRVRFQGADIQASPPQEIVRRGLSLVPQDRGLFPHMTVAQNLTLGSYLERGGRRAVSERMDQIVKWFPILGGRANQRAHTLSGGEQQMLAIARALMRRPALLMLDEPSLALAPKVIDTIAAILEDLGRAGTTILLVEQNVRFALRVASRAYVLALGSIVLSAPAQELATDERIQHIYLGAGARTGAAA